METVLAVLMALGIYVGIPIIIGLSICSVFVMADRRARRSEQAKAIKEQEAIEKPEEKPALVR